MEFVTLLDPGFIIRAFFARKNLEKCKTFYYNVICVVFLTLIF